MPRVRKNQVEKYECPVCALVLCTTVFTLVKHLIQNHMDDSGEVELKPFKENDNQSESSEDLDDPMNFNFLGDDDEAPEATTEEKNEASEAATHGTIETATEKHETSETATDEISETPETSTENHDTSEPEITNTQPTDPEQGQDMDSAVPKTEQPWDFSRLLKRKRYQAIANKHKKLKKLPDISTNPPDKPNDADVEVLDLPDLEDPLERSLPEREQQDWTKTPKQSKDPGDSDIDPSSLLNEFLEADEGADESETRAETEAQASINKLISELACPHCPFVGATLCSRKTHISKKHGDKIPSYQPRAGPLPSQAVSSKQLFRCSNCANFFPNDPAAYSAHGESCASAVGRSQLLHCPHCKRVFTSSQGLNAHLKQAHKDQNEFNL